LLDKSFHYVRFCLERPSWWWWLFFIVYRLYIFR